MDVMLDVPRSITESSLSDKLLQRIRPGPLHLKLLVQINFFFFGKQTPWLLFTVNGEEQREKGGRQNKAIMQLREDVALNDFFNVPKVLFS